jgi:hypothetical protein
VFEARQALRAEPKATTVDAVTAAVDKASAARHAETVAARLVVNAEHERPVTVSEPCVGAAAPCSVPAPVRNPTGTRLRLLLARLRALLDEIEPPDDEDGTDA